MLARAIFLEAVISEEWGFEGVRYWWRKMPAFQKAHKTEMSLGVTTPVRPLLLLCLWGQGQVEQVWVRCESFVFGNLKWNAVKFLEIKLRLLQSFVLFLCRRLNRGVFAQFHIGQLVKSVFTECLFCSGTLQSALHILFWSCLTGYVRCYHYPRAL